MFLVSPCSCLCSIQWSQVLSQEWRCSWSSADRRCSNYIWVIDSFIAYQSTTYIRDLTVPGSWSVSLDICFVVTASVYTPGTLVWTLLRVCHFLQGHSLSLDSQANGVFGANFPGQGCIFPSEVPSQEYIFFTKTHKISVWDKIIGSFSNFSPSKGIFRLTLVKMTRKWANNHQIVPTCSQGYIFDQIFPS